MWSVRSLATEKATRAATRFARKQCLAMDDPIVLSLLSGLKSTMRRPIARNKRRSDQSDLQSTLFSSSVVPTLMELKGVAPNATGSLSTQEFLDDLRDE
jgi:hypothetical protein